MLVVDDEPLILRVVTRMLGRIGVETVGVSSLAEARAQLFRSRFDLVLSDIALGDGSGIDLAAALLAAGAPPVVLMSGAPERLEDAVSRLGIRVLPKPIEIGVLRGVIETLPPAR